jgi:hypothetical protein
MKRHPPFALKSILLVCFAGFLLAGCRTTPKENSEDFAQIGEDEVLEERITLNILSALDSGDIDKTRKYAELPIDFMGYCVLGYFGVKKQHEH